MISDVGSKDLNSQPENNGLWLIDYKFCYKTKSSLNYQLSIINCQFSIDKVPNL